MTQANMLAPGLVSVALAVSSPQALTAEPEAARRTPHPHPRDTPSPTCPAATALKPVAGTAATLSSTSRRRACSPRRARTPGTEPRVQRGQHGDAVRERFGRQGADGDERGEAVADHPALRRKLQGVDAWRSACQDRSFCSSRGRSRATANGRPVGAGDLAAQVEPQHQHRPDRKRRILRRRRGADRLRRRLDHRDDAPAG